MKLDSPNVTPQKSNEENIQLIRSYLENLVNELTFKIEELEARISKLEK